jgi:hypothetical protein
MLCVEALKGAEAFLAPGRYFNGLARGGYEQLIAPVSPEADMMQDSGDADIEQTIRFATTDLLILAVPVLVEEGRVEDARRLEREFVERFGISEIVPQ